MLCGAASSADELICMWRGSMAVVYSSMSVGIVVAAFPVVPYGNRSSCLA